MPRSRSLVVAAALSALLAAGLSVAALAQALENVPLSQKVSKIYQAVTGSPPPESAGLRDQIDAVTQLLYGSDWQKKVSPSLVDRVNQLMQLVTLGDPNRSLFSRIMAIEWTINQSLYEWELVNQKGTLDVSSLSTTEPPLRSLRERVGWVEILLYGKEQPGGLVERVDRLAREVWGGSGQARLATKVVKVTPGAGSVRIKLLGTISNERENPSTVGQKVPFVVMDALVLEGALVLPRGAVGIATVEEVQPPSLGRPGRLSASGQVWAIDGIPLGATLGLDEQASAGISRVGAGLSGPTAGPTGLLVQGAARALQPGTVLVAAIGPAPGWREAPVINALVQ